MKEAKGYLVIVFVVIALLVMVVACGCGTMRWAFGIPDPPDNATVNPGEDSAPPEDAKREAHEFEVGVFLSWLVPTAALIAAAVLLGFKPMVPIIAGGGLIIATAMAASLAFWEIMFSLLALAVLAALVFGLMWLRRSRTLKKVVTSVEKKAEADPAFNAAVTEAMKDADGKNILSDAETALVDKMRGKTK